MKRFFNVLLLSVVFIGAFVSFVSPIVDSKYTFAEAMSGTLAPADVVSQMDIIDVLYYSFDGKLHKGQIVVNKEVVEDVRKVFAVILKEKFPIEKCIPIVKYDWCDDSSMADNNSSAFNYRHIANTKRLSKHSFGKAVDINPVQNPVIYSNGNISPPNSRYNIKAKGTLTSTCEVVKKFKLLGWRWGGDFQSFKDYHHFDKD